MAASTIGTSCMNPRLSVNGFTLQDLPDHSNTKLFLPSTTMFACESSSDLGSPSGFPLNSLLVSAILAIRCLLGWSDSSLLPSIKTLEQQIGSCHFLFFRISFNFTFVERVEKDPVTLPIATGVPGGGVGATTVGVGGREG